LRKFIFLILTLIVLVPIKTAVAEEIDFIWAERAGGSIDPPDFPIADRARAITIDSAGDLVIVGDFAYEAEFDGTIVTAIGFEQGSPSRGPADIFAAKYDAEGNLKWIRHTGGNFNDAYNEYGPNLGTDVTTDGEDNIIVTGQYPGSITFDQITLPVGDYNQEMFVVKYDPNGNVLWAKAGTGRYHSRGLGVSTDNAGNVFVTGSFGHQSYQGYITFDGTQLTTYGGGDIFIAKYDSFGQFLWARQAGSSRYGPGAYDVGMDVAADNQGNSIITGFYNGTANFSDTVLPSFGSLDIHIAKYDPSGNLLWAKRAGGAGDDRGHGIVVDILGYSIIVGGFEGSANFGGTVLNSVGERDIFIAKYDPSGNLLWAERAGGASDDIALSIAIDINDDILVSGYFAGTALFGGTELQSNGDDDIFVAKYDSDGNFIEAISAGGTSRDYGYGIAADDYGNSFVTGLFHGTADFGSIDLTSAGGADIFFTKVGVVAQNNPPVADAGPNLSIMSEEQSATTICGTANDSDNDPLTYRWLEGQNELLSWQDVGAEGQACLDLIGIPYFSIGEHTLILEVTDGQETATDSMILTVDNSAPHAAPTGGGTYEIYSPVTLGGQVSDFDGDILTYEWLESDDVLFSDNQSTIYGGDPVTLPDHIVSDLSLGIHILTLRVNDGVNDSVSSDITVEVIDGTDPTLAPVSNKTILWPPNHKMVDIVIEANASDNSGGAVTLSASVSSNEPEDGLGDGDTAPDWTEPVIDQENGIISLQLRSERSGSGEGRVYTITITASDESGNFSTADVEIIVPHDKGK